MSNSLVQLDSVVWDVDPELYAPMDAARRGSVHRIIDDGTGIAGTVYQDMGVLESDHVIELSGVLTSDATGRALWALYRRTGQVYLFKDFKLNQFNVVFTPGARFRCEPIKGSNIGWRYTMSLSVVNVVAWFGSTSGYPPQS